MMNISMLLEGRNPRVYLQGLVSILDINLKVLDRDRVRTMLNDGMTEAETLASDVTTDFDGEWNGSGGRDRHVTAAVQTARN